MPVIIPERDYDRWLKPNPERPPIDLLRPFDSEKMTAWKVDKAVGTVKNDRPDLIEPASATPESVENQHQAVPDLFSPKAAISTHINASNLAAGVENSRFEKT